MDILRHRRCRVLKRIPKASRIPAAEKLAQTLQQIISNRDCIQNWIEVLTFPFACFGIPGIPGGRGGKRHLSSLALKVNALIACFPANSQSLPPLKYQEQVRLSGDQLAARVSGNIRGAIRLAGSV